jgi:hypothetical protein
MDDCRRSNCDHPAPISYVGVPFVNSPTPSVSLTGYYDGSVGERWCHCHALERFRAAFGGNCPSDTSPAADTDPSAPACRPAMPYAEPKEQP